jgi:hypothetical protein
VPLKKTIHLTEMPEGYISIASGLGDAPRIIFTGAGSYEGGGLVCWK